MTTQAAKTARSEVLCCETKTGLDGWSEVSGCLVSTHYKEPPLVVLGDCDMLVQVNSNGGHVMPTISADEYKQAQAQKDRGGGYILCYFTRNKQFVQL